MVASKRVGKQCPPAKPGVKGKGSKGKKAHGYSNNPNAAKKKCYTTVTYKVPIPSSEFKKTVKNETMQ